MQAGTSTLPGSLYVVGTPIGNLRDISFRALDILAAVDFIAAEDTRVTARLLEYHSITKKMISMHRHNEASTVKRIERSLADGNSVALLTDAGTPGISDPGALLVKHIRNMGYKVIPIPGANAAVCALSAAGIITPHFLFYGFLPANPGARRRELQNLKLFPYTLIFYEAPHRILECVTDLVEVMRDHRELTIARELTKLFETIHVCPLKDAVVWLEEDPNRQRGEFVLMLTGFKTRNEAELGDEAQHVLKLLMDALPLKQAVKLAADITGESRNLLYTFALSLRNETTSPDDA
ncbi:16S rRNA (cytidine(1402)-2'-O)-methyltransferase [Nitrosovibrio tenuis]|uniref:Ribosomal RNA small subunit methyltransferase I n=1 Tax=Nitrosovibrio tenuis TaxID=1233 RepID=A0A1H7RGB6_9PROT|nr:16S rRNA (cytidine(1402)-2'-O)-methyltransferase [Nitrosovibrio tenuis]SEL59291.1 16S rRNA (cytidine1402-2'-O)-methyltransferase [Nitrosovibrio tenuis]